MTTKKIRKILAIRALKEDMSLSKRSVKKAIKQIDKCIGLVDIAINILNKKG